MSPFSALEGADICSMQWALGADRAGADGLVGAGVLAGAEGTALCGERRKRGPDLACDPSDIYVGASAAMLRAAAQRREGPESSD